ncbi:MAG: hypothetical protein IPK06_04390 [Ignavibacteriae bacterium]|nr:hypothetical protein [Ignavibacteriota bacterium]
MGLIEVTLKQPYTQYGVEYNAGDKIKIRESKIPSFVENGLIDAPNKINEKKGSSKTKN